MDTLTRAQRSERMSRIGGKDTKPELTLRRSLHALGYRYRLHGAGLPGRPDLVFRKHKTAVFVHGCFWHRHKGCSIATNPKSNIEFWTSKFEANMKRDRLAERALRALGWRVFIVWQCELKPRLLDRTVSRLARGIKAKWPKAKRQ